ncbi:hypothetical protein SAMN05444397_108242 [Flavobacterium aquidurense]|nr:hypothetical protein SAMN05444397_108242 [Flavobacterium aquidurense]
MKNLNKLKILIVGLTTVLALSNFNSHNPRKGIVRLYNSVLNGSVCQSDFIQINT